MTKKIFRSILFSTIIVLLCGIVVVMGFLYEYFSDLQKTQLSDTLGLVASMVENGAELETVGERYRFTLISPDGTVLADTKTDAQTLENHSDRIEFIDAKNKGYGESVRYSSTLMEKTMYVAKLLSDGSVLRISVSRATVGFLLLGTLQPTIIIMIIVFLLADILARKLSKRIVEPLNSLDLDHPLDNDAYDELSPLLNRINHQHEQIDSQLRELRRRTAEFDQITSSLNECLILLDKSGTVLSLNPAALRLFGEFKAGVDFLSVDRSTQMTTALEKTKRDGHAEFRREKNGLVWQFDLSRIDQGGVVILAVDVTEREKAEELRREFTANVSHELKTPLQGIIGSAELLSSGMVKDEDKARFVGHISSEAKRLVTLIGDIIELSELDEGIDLPKAEFDVSAVALNVIEELSDKASERKISFIPELSSVTVNSDESLLREVIFNLCDNAIKYGKDGGSVKLTVKPASGGCEVIVADDGIGIPAEHLPHVFERFYRVDKSRSKASGGTGLGLSIVRHAVSCLGGEVSIESSVGVGTTVTVRI